MIRQAIRAGWAAKSQEPGFPANRARDQTAIGCNPHLPTASKDATDHAPFPRASHSATISKADEGVKANLHRIIDKEIPGTIIVYDGVDVGNGGCGQWFMLDWAILKIDFNSGMQYRVAGFATFRFTSFRLNTGHGPCNHTFGRPGQPSGSRALRLR